MIWGGANIIRAGAASLEVLEALHGACFSRGWDQVEMARVLAMPGTSGTLILPDHRDGGLSSPSGFLLGREVAEEAEIISIGVLPTARQRGLGGALLAEFITRMQEHGVRTLFLEVATHNEAAISLYKRQGFIAAGLRKAYYAPEPGQSTSTDALIMRCNL